ncbi:hypothetical protein, partial [Enterococcus faecium]|uniref:hypothetical protein n=1 Tax=Enterococcus faecium TaxID=1352 RepID=UPI003CF1C44A
MKIPKIRNFIILSAFKINISLKGFTQSEYLTAFKTSENKNKSTKKNKLKERVGCFCLSVHWHSSSFLQVQL